MATHNVTNTNDSGIGSLRQAINDANINPGIDTILLNNNVTLTNSINITDSLIITGNNSVITQTGSDRLFKIDNAATSLIDVTLNSLTLTGGNPIEYGGAIYTVENLTLNDVVVENNATNKSGGGIYSENAALVIKNSRLADNNIADAITSAGAALYSLNGILNIDNSIIESNKSMTGVITAKNSKTTITNTQINNNNGGAIFLTESSEAVINNVEVINNIVEFDNSVGGAILITNNSQASISNTIVRDNQATFGGGIFIGNQATAIINNTQITNNIATEAGGGIDLANYSKVTIRDSLISGNTAPVGSGLNTLNHSGALFVNVGVNNNSNSKNQLEGDNIRFGGANIDKVGLPLGYVHRFYQHEKGCHLYTSDVVEVDTIKNKSFAGELKYNYEFEKFNVLTSNKDRLTGAVIAGAKEVYRFFNNQTGAHIYTMDEVEKQYIQDNLANYNYEGVKFYAFETDQAEINTIPIYRMLNSLSGSHLFTTDSNEINHIKENLPHFSLEANNGIAFYVMDL